jgi:hypothetical protein
MSEQVKTMSALMSMLASMSSEESRDVALALHDTPLERQIKEAVRCGDLEELVNATLRPFKAYLEGFAKEDMLFGFLISHSDFVEHQLRWWVKQYEPSPCVSDIVTTISARLCRHLASGEPLVLVRQSEADFHLPRYLFQEPDELLWWLKGVCNLYYGSMQKYQQQTERARVAAETRRDKDSTRH